MKKFLKSLKYAINGIWSGIADQPNLKVQMAIAAIVIGAGFYFQITTTEWCIVLLCIALVVIGLEMINSAIESLVDLVTLERMPLAGRIKDIAAGAVLLVSIIAVMIGIIIFRKYLDATDNRIIFFYGYLTILRQSMNYYIDTHAHIYHEDFAIDRADMLHRCEEQRITKIFMPNVDHTSIDGMLELESRSAGNVFSDDGSSSLFCKKRF